MAEASLDVVKDITSRGSTQGDQKQKVDATTLVSSYFMPAEWSPHLACLILYPHNATTFLRLQQAQEQVRKVAQAIVNQGEEDVILFCVNDQAAEELQEMLHLEQQQAASSVKHQIHVKTCPSNDTWARDTAATFLVSSHSSNKNNSHQRRQKLIGLDWEFNGYGGPIDGAYWPCDLDQHIASHTCRLLESHYPNLSISIQPVPLVLEGGSIHTDGQGTVLTTEECLLHAKNRNPTKCKSEIQDLVLSHLNCTKMIWLPYGIAADEDTNGHVDNMACFASPGHVILSWCDDADHDVDNYQRCRAAMDVLQHETDAQGRTLTIHKLHVPPPMYYSQEDIMVEASKDGSMPETFRSVGQRLAASYVNFYIANKAVIVPQFDHCDDTNQRAFETLQQVFPDRTVVGVASRAILLGGGNIHCITQQVPLG